MIASYLESEASQLFHEANTDVLLLTLNEHGYIVLQVHYLEHRLTRKYHGQTLLRYLHNYQFSTRENLVGYLRRIEIN